MHESNSIYRTVESARREQQRDRNGGLLRVILARPTAVRRGERVHPTLSPAADLRCNAHGPLLARFAARHHVPRCVGVSTCVGVPEGIWVSTCVGVPLSPAPRAACIASIAQPLILAVDRV